PEAGGRVYCGESSEELVVSGEWLTRLLTTHQSLLTHKHASTQIPIHPRASAGDFGCAVADRPRNRLCAAGLDYLEVHPAYARAAAGGAADGDRYGFRASGADSAGN